MKKIAITLFAFVALACTEKKATSQSEQKIETKEQTSSSLNQSVEKLNENKPFQEANKLATFKFEEKAFDFGKVDEGAVVTHVFKFKNTGKQPLIISKINTTCGCTTPEYTRKPIPAGENGEITVRFNTKGKRYKQVKTISVYANTSPSLTALQIRGEVTPEPDLSNGPVRQ